MIRLPNHDGAPDRRAEIRGPAVTAAAALDREAPRPALVMMSIALAVVPALSGSARGLLVPELKLSDVLVLILLVLITLRRGLNWKPLGGLGAAIAIYAFIALALTLWNFAERVDLTQGQLLKEALNAPQYLLIFIVAYVLGQKARSTEPWLLAVAIAGASIAIVAILQYFDLGPTRAILTDITGNPAIAHPIEWKANRSTGPFFSWHALGMYLAMSTSLTFAVLSQASLSRRARGIMNVSLIVMAMGLLTAITLTPVLLLVTVGLIFGVRSPRARVWVAVVGLVGAVLLLLTELGTTALERLDSQERTTTTDYPWLPQTIGYRMTIWVRDYFPILRQHLWTGYGPLGEADSGVFPYTESMYIEMLLRGGIPQLVAFIAMMFAALAVVRGIERRARALPERVLETPIASVIAAMTGFLLVAQLIHPYMLDAGSSAFMFSAWGLIGGRSVYLRQREARALDTNLTLRGVSAR